MKKPRRALFPLGIGLATTALFNKLRKIRGERSSCFETLTPRAFQKPKTAKKLKI